MIRLAPLFALALLALAACDASAPAGEDAVLSRDLEGTPENPPPPAPEVSDTLRDGDGLGDGVNDGNPDLTPPALTPEAERTEIGARSVLVNWARAIELQEWDQAWRMMSEADRAKWSRAEFAALFSDLSDITVAVPTGTMEGAAGSSYYTAPVSITGSDADGRPLAYDGEMVLRRVNDIDGSSAEDRRWNIQRVDLDWTH